MGTSELNVDVRLHHWGRNTLSFLERYVRGGTRLIRIATGFFSVPVYGALRPSIARILTWVLVGFDERAHDAILENLLEDVIEDLRSWNDDRYELVAAHARDLGQSLRLVNARTRDNDHAKVYIVDNQAALVGSSNLEVVPVMLDPVSGEINEIADDLALKHLRCDPEGPVAFINPGTVEKLRHRAVSAWRSKRLLPADAKGQHVCSCVLMSREAPGGLVAGC